MGDILYHYWQAAKGKVYTKNFDTADGEVPTGSYGQILAVAADKRLCICRLSIRIKGPLVTDALALRFGSTANEDKTIGIWYQELTTAGAIGIYEVILQVPRVGEAGEDLYGFTANTADGPAFTMDYMLVPA